MKLEEKNRDKVLKRSKEKKMLIYAKITQIPSTPTYSSDLHCLEIKTKPITHRFVTKHLSIRPI